MAASLHRRLRSEAPLVLALGGRHHVPAAEPVGANLAVLAALSAPGSRLAPTYLSKDHGRIPHSIFLGLLGDPLRPAYAPAEITNIAKTCGGACTADSGIEDWLRDLTPGLPLAKRQAGLRWFERIWIAEKSS
jgi:hypothetical protein